MTIIGLHITQPNGVRPHSTRFGLNDFDSGRARVQLISLNFFGLHQAKGATRNDNNPNSNALATVY